MLRLLSLVTLIMLSLIAGCSPRTESTGGQGRVDHGLGDVIVHSEWSGSVLESPTSPQMSGGRGIGFVRWEDWNADPSNRPQNQEFRQPLGEDFAPILILGNGADAPRTFLVAAVLDYKQVQFGLDGKKGLLHEVVVPAGTDIGLPFAIEIRSPGVHDIQVIAFDNPYDESLDVDYRSNLYGYLAGRRAQVIVGEGEMPARYFQPTPAGTPIPSDVTFVPNVGFAQAPTADTASIDPSRRQLYVDSATGGKPYHFQVVISNTMEVPTTYALIPFLNFHQTAITESDLILISIEPGQQVILDAEVMLPKEPAVNQVQLVYLFDPYRSVLRKEVTAPFVFGSPRIAVDTRPTK